jgi:hypothetical protein
VPSAAQQTLEAPDVEGTQPRRAAKRGRKAVGEGRSRAVQGRASGGLEEGRVAASDSKGRATTDLVEALQEAIGLELGAEQRLQLSRSQAARLQAALAHCPGTNLRARVRGLKVAVGLEEAAALLRSHPALLVGVHPLRVPARLDALANAFRADRAAVVRLCSTTRGAAQVLCLLPYLTGRRVEALCDTLQLDHGALLVLCCKYPLVLNVGPDDVRARAAALRGGLGLGPAQVARLCRRHPTCLLVRPVTTLAAVEAVRAAFDMRREDAVRLCLRNPSVLQRSAGSIADKAEVLKQLLGLPSGDLGKYLVRHGASCRMTSACMCMTQLGVLYVTAATGCAEYVEAGMRQVPCYWSHDSGTHSALVPRVGAWGCRLQQM